MVSDQGRNRIFALLMPAGDPPQPGRRRLDTIRNEGGVPFWSDATIGSIGFEKIFIYTKRYNDGSLPTAGDPGANTLGRFGVIRMRL